jgi:uncharacterized membrane protein
MDWRGISDTIGFAGSVASVVALYQAGRVWSRVQKVERSYRQQMCLPDYSRQLKAGVRNLLTAQKARNRQNATTELARCEAALTSAADLVEKTMRRRIGEMCKTVAAMRTLSANDTTFFLELGSMIAEIAAIQFSIANYVSEQPWRRANGS